MIDLVTQNERAQKIPHAVFLVHNARVGRKGRLHAAEERQLVVLLLQIERIDGDSGKVSREDQPLFAIVDIDAGGEEETLRLLDFGR